MAVEIYLKLDGIDGESAKSGAEKWIEVFSFSNGASNASSSSLGGGHSSGKVDISSIQISKELDSASAALFLNCCQGTHIPKGQLVVRKSTGGDTTEVFLKYELTEVFIDSISWGGSSGGGDPAESLSLSFTEITISYSPQDGTGKIGAAKTAGWDVKTNKKL